MDKDGWRPIETAQEMEKKVRGQRVIPSVERIMCHVEIDDDSGCWNWTGSVRSLDKPYGRLTIGSRSDGSRRTIGAHQYSYMTFRGPINSGLCVCHHCDNPRCVNPKHLFLGTKKDNADDRDRKGRLVRAPVLRGEHSPSAKLSAEQVRQIRLSKLPSTKIAHVYGVCSSHIRALRRGEHFPPPPSGPRP